MGSEEEKDTIKYSKVYVKKLILGNLMITKALSNVQEKRQQWKLNFVD
jgi:hypothetical protein